MMVAQWFRRIPLILGLCVVAATIAGVVLEKTPEVASASGFTGVSAGLNHTCSLTAGGGAKCWGYNFYRQLGDGTRTQRTTPVDVVGLGSGVTAIAAGGYHTCALTSGGGVKCWGDNLYGELGNGSFFSSSTPVNVSGLTGGVTAIAAAVDHNCALTSGGGVKCWGSNFRGQLGDGTTTDRPVPVDVLGLTSGVAAISAGGAHSCALTTGGAVKCWGSEWLAEGGITNRTAPVDVVGVGSGVAAIAAGNDHTCALTNESSMKCWGRNNAGQLGDGTFGTSTTPVNVVGLGSGVTAIAAGGNHTCALTPTGGAKCWGYNVQGGLGDGTLGDQGDPTSGVPACYCRTTPVDVVGLGSGVTAIAAGGDFHGGGHTCAVTDDGLKCWGSNFSGQLGIGTDSGPQLCGAFGGTAPCSTTPMDVVEPPDLFVSKTASSDTVSVGDTLTYSITVGNNGPSDITGVVMVDSLSSGVTYLSDDCGGTVSGGVWRQPIISTLVVGTTETCHLVVQVNDLAPLALSNTATFDWSGGIDPDSSNNSATAVTSVTPNDLFLTKSADKQTVSPGETLVYEVATGNHGPADDAFLRISDTLPLGVSYLSDDCGGSASLSGSTTIWRATVGPLLANAPPILCHITVQVNEDAPDELTNTASILPSPFINRALRRDPDRTNNSDSVVTLVVADIEASYLEVNQAVQIDPAGVEPPVPLIGGKPAVIRVYLKAKGSTFVRQDDAVASHITGKLHVACGATSWVLDPLSSGASIASLTLDGTERKSSRTELDSTLNFIWVTPPVGPASCVLRARVNLEEGPAQIVERDYSNNERQESYAFEASPGLRILLVGLQYQRTASGASSVNIQAIRDYSFDFLRATYPIQPSSVAVAIDTQPLVVDQEVQLPGEFSNLDLLLCRSGLMQDAALRRYCQAFQGVSARLGAWNRVHPDQAADIAVGVLPQPVSCATQLGTSVFTQRVAFITDGCRPDLVLAHEVGHFVLQEGNEAHPPAVDIGADGLIVDATPRLASGYVDFMASPVVQDMWVSRETYTDLLSGLRNIR